MGHPNIAARGLVADVTRVPPASRPERPSPSNCARSVSMANGALQRKGCQEAAGYVDLVTHTSTEASIGRTAAARIERVELRRLRLPLVSPFRTSFGTSTARDVLLVRVDTAAATGWGECVADSEPTYSSEYADGAQHVLREHLLPARWPARAGATVTRRGRVCSRPSRATRWRRRPWRRRSWTPSCAPPGCPSPTYLGAVADRVPAGV